MNNETGNTTAGMTNTGEGGENITVTLKGAKKKVYTTEPGKKLKDILDFSDSDNFTFRLKGKSTRHSKGSGHPVALSRVINESLELDVVKKTEQG